MIKEELLEMINLQIKREFDSANIYLAMAIDMADKGWDGFANWMFKQADEEIQHAREMIHYVLTRGEKPELRRQDEIGSIKEGVIPMFEAAYDHECFISRSINEIVTKARDLQDYATEGFFKTFVREQVEEEDTVAGIVAKLKLGNSEAGFLVINGQLGQRQ